MKKFKVINCIPASYYEVSYVEANSIEEAHSMLPNNYEDRMGEPSRDIDTSSLVLHRIDSEYVVEPDDK